MRLRCRKMQLKRKFVSVDSQICFCNKYEKFFERTALLRKMLIWRNQRPRTGNRFDCKLHSHILHVINRLEFDKFLDLHYTNRFSGKCIASRTIFEGVPVAKLKRVIGSPSVKKHGDVWSCKEYSHIVWLQKGSIGSIEVDGWSIEKGTVKMERSFRGKSKWKRQELGHYVKEIDIIRLKYLSR